MREVEKQSLRKGAIGRLWTTPLAQRLAALAGLVLIGAGYAMILGSSGLPNVADVEAVSRNAVGGMLLVVCGGVVEVLLLLGNTRH